MNFTGAQNERYILLELDENDDGIPWRQFNRRVLNVAIRRFNQWNEDGCPDEQWGVVKAYVEMAEREIRANMDGGGRGYDDEFGAMYTFLKAREPQE